MADQPQSDDEIIAEERKVYRAHMRAAVLWGLATGGIPNVSERMGKRYFLPLTATYSMRMQSNFYFKWLMHLDPDRGSVTP